VNRILVFTLVIVLLLSGCSAPTAEGVEIQDAWMRPAARGGNGAVYFAIHSSAAEELIRVSSDVAEAVEMHESKMSGDVMEMRQMQSVPLGAGEEVIFEPGGLHVMLVNLRQDLNAGDEIDITLHFKNYQDIPLRVPVQDTPASEHDH
jgi:periplasmic copper chaperone A